MRAPLVIIGAGGHGAEVATYAVDLGWNLLGAIDDNFVLVGLLGLLLTNMALVGNLARVERKFLFIELDTIATIVVYLLGLYLLFIRGIGA